jgi:uncharacterized protein YaiE (UPF0345 family)
MKQIHGYHSTYAGFAYPSLLILLTLIIIFTSMIQSSTLHLIDLSRPLQSYSKGMSYNNASSDDFGLKCTEQVSRLCWLERQTYRLGEITGALSANKVLSLPSLNQLSKVSLPCPTSLNISGDARASLLQCKSNLFTVTESGSFSGSLKTQTLKFESPENRILYLFVTGDLDSSLIDGSDSIVVMAMGKINIHAAKCRKLHLISLGESVQVDDSGVCNLRISAKNYSDSSPKHNVIESSPTGEISLPQPLWVY